MSIWGKIKHKAKHAYENNKKWAKKAGEVIGGVGSQDAETGIDFEENKDGDKASQDTDERGTGL